MLSACGAGSSGGGTSTSIWSAALTRYSGSRMVRPPIVTAPSRMSAFSRVRDRPSIRIARTRSRRAPESSGVAITVSLRSLVGGMSNPSPDDEKPLDPAAQRIVDKVRWLMVLSGFATFLGIAVVIGVVGYRFFRAEGSAAPSEVVAMLPKGAKIVSVAPAQDRIVVTLEIAGATEIRTF